MRQNQQNKQRMRGRPNRKAPNPLTRSFDSNGPDIKIRGTALHIAEKYTQLARDASSAGDRVMAENYLQHAEHYYRIIAAAQAAQLAAAQGREDEESDDDFEPIGSDRFEPRQIEIKTPGSYDNNRQPQEVRPERDNQPNRDYQPRQEGERPEGGRSDNRNDNRGERYQSRQQDGGERQDGRNNEFRRDRRSRFDRFGRGERGERAPQDNNNNNNRQERAPVPPAIVPTLADAPQPDVSFPDISAPVVVERPVVIERPVVVERPVMAEAEAPVRTAEVPAALPLDMPAGEAAEGEATRRRAPRRRAGLAATTAGSEAAPRPRARRTRASADSEPAAEVKTEE